MTFPKYFRVRETAVIANPTPTLLRCVARGEVALVRSEGYLAGETGVPLLAIVPIEVFREILRGLAYPAEHSKSWDELPTELAPPDPT